MELYEKLKNLSLLYPQDIILYPQDFRKILKLPGRIYGEFDHQLLEFLKITNGLSVLSYCFYGFKNTNRYMRTGLHENVMELWPIMNHIAGLVIPFMSGGSGVNFGYLINVVVNGAHPIVSFNEFPEDTVLVAPCFNSFFDTFLDEVKQSLDDGNSIEIDRSDWPENFDYWALKAPELFLLVKQPNVAEELRKLTL